MGGTGTHRQREGGGDALGRLLPGCRNTGSVSARSAISAYQRACKPRVTKSRALICSFHGEVGIDPDAALAALAKSCSRSRARADSFGDKFAKLELTREFQVMLSAAPGVPRVRFHDLRHTAATLLLAQGVDPRTIMETLGHSQISLTLNTYSHVLPAFRMRRRRRWTSRLAGDDADACLLYTSDAADE